MQLVQWLKYNLSFSHRRISSVASLSWKTFFHCIIISLVRPFVSSQKNLILFLRRFKTIQYKRDARNKFDDRQN